MPTPIPAFAPVDKAPGAGTGAGTGAAGDDVDVGEDELLAVDDDVELVAALGFCLVCVPLTIK